MIWPGKDNVCRFGKGLVVYDTITANGGIIFDDAHWILLWKKGSIE